MYLLATFRCGGSGGDEGNFLTLADCHLECVLPRTMKHLEREAHQPAIEARTTSQVRQKVGHGRIDIFGHSQLWGTAKNLSVTISVRFLIIVATSYT